MKSVSIHKVTLTDQYNLLMSLWNERWSPDVPNGAREIVRDEILALILLKLLDMNPLEAVVPIADLIEWYEKAIKKYPDLENERINGGVEILKARIGRGGENED
jgi:hypothetical protein